MGQWASALCCCLAGPHFCAGVRCSDKASSVGTGSDVMALASRAATTWRVEPCCQPLPCGALVYCMSPGWNFTASVQELKAERGRRGTCCLGRSYMCHCAGLRGQLSIHCTHSCSCGLAGVTGHVPLYHKRGNEQTLLLYLPCKILLANAFPGATGPTCRPCQGSPCRAALFGKTSS